MNPRTLLISLLGLCALASAQVVPKVPVLSEPRSIPLSAISFDAWGDTLIAARMGTTYRIVRKGDQVVMVDSIVSDSLRSEMPRNLEVGDGTHLQVSYSWLATVDWQAKKASVALKGVDMGYARAEGELFRKSGNDTLYGFLCSAYKSFLVKRPNGGAWALQTSLPLDGDLVQHCAVDPTSGQAVRFFYSPKVGDSSRMIGLGDARRLLDLTSGFQSVAIKPTAVFAESNGWLAYDDSLGKIMIRYDDGTDRPSMDRTIYPPELARLNDKYVRPVRKDSLMVFGGDSTLVLAGWNRGQFSVYQTIQLDDRIFYAMALGDSVLWVRTANKVLSFRVGWKERPSGVHRASSIPLNYLRMSQQGGVLSFEWSGSQETSILVLGLDGTVHMNARIAPNGRANMTTKGKSGILVVSTSQRSAQIMVTK